jgi:hypothetical protein
MTQTHDRGLLAGPFVMFISAAIFGYFGFFFGLTSTTTAGNVVFFFGLLLWTLRIAAIGFLLSGLLTFAAPLAGNLLYSVTGLLSAAGLVLVGIMDLADAQRAAAISPVLAFLFAAWNGYGAWSGLRSVAVLLQARSPRAGSSREG